MEHNQLIILPSLLLVLTLMPQTIKVFLLVVIVSQTIKVVISQRQTVGDPITITNNYLEVPWNNNSI